MRRSRRGFTLVEILSCVAIVIALAGIVFSVYRGAIGSGKRTDEISQLHQIALAANLYREQNDLWPGNTTDLVVSGLVPKATCYSRRDPYRNGWANWFLKDLASYRADQARMIAPFPNTFLCFTDVQQYRREDAYRLLNEQPNGGLFVSLVDSINTWPKGAPIGPLKGPYFRVLLDGSVQRRMHRSFSGRDSHGKPITFGSYDVWFFDPTDEWINATLSSF